MKLIIGLGNPGKEYEKTRHNVGRELVLRTAEVLSADAFTFDKKHDALTSSLNRSGLKVMFALPETFMNRSGDAVGKLIRYYKIKPEDVLIVQDDMDFDVGKFSFTLGGGDAGHRGVRSVYEHAGKDIYRLRVGIGRPSRQGTASEDYVLNRFSPTEKIKLGLTRGKMIDAITDWIDLDPAKTMNSWN